MKQLTIFVFVVLFFVLHASTSFAQGASDFPMIYPSSTSGGSAFPALGGGGTMYNEAALTREDIAALSFLVVASAILSFLIYRRNKKDKELGLMHADFTLWNSALFLVILAITWIFFDNFFSLNSFVARFYPVINIAIDVLMGIVAILFSHYAILLFKNRKSHILTSVIVFVLVISMLAARLLFNYFGFY